MKYYLIVLLLILSTSEIFPQQQVGFIHLTEVEKAPASSTCSESSAVCTAAVIEKFLAESLIGTPGQLLNNGTSGKTEVAVRVIIDTLGQVTRASVKGIPGAAGKTLASRLKEMQPMSPGEHENKKVNVIADFKVPFYIWEAKDSISEAIPWEEADQKPVWPKCIKEENPEICTSSSVSDWMNSNLNTSVVKEPGRYSVTSGFILGKNGDVQRIVVHGDNENLAQEVINQLKKLPKFIWENDGEPEAISYLLPINFRKL